MIEQAVNVLKVFIKSPNGVGNVGEDRDKLVPSVAINSLSHTDTFYRLGMSIGHCLRQQDCVPLSLPHAFWKLLKQETITWHDLTTISINDYNNLGFIA